MQTRFFRRRFFVILGLLGACAAAIDFAATSVVKNAAASTAAVEHPYNKAWQDSLQQWGFQFDTTRCGVMYCLSQFRGDCKIEMIYDPARWWMMTFKLLHGDKEIATFEGNQQSVFCGSKHVLYFAQFSMSSEGCRVIAFDTTTGAKVWQHDLEAAGNDMDHSAYSNRVIMQVGTEHPGEDGKKLFSDEEQDKGTLIITGSEVAGDYIEVLDMKTGRTLAHRLFRSWKDDVRPKPMK